MLHVSSFPAVRGSAKRVRAATSTPAAWQHADNARSSFASSEASWAASCCLTSLRLVYDISHGSRKTMSLLSTNANLGRLLILPSGECSRAGMINYSLISRRSEFGVAESRFGRCFPTAWLSTPSTWTLMRACAPASCGCSFLPVAKRCCRSSKATISSGGPKPRLFWSHPYQRPRLRSPRRLRSPLPSARPGCEDPGPPGLLPRMRPVSCVGLCI